MGRSHVLASLQHTKASYFQFSSTPLRIPYGGQAADGRCCTFPNPLTQRRWSSASTIGVLRLAGFSLGLYHMACGDCTFVGHVPLAQGPALIVAIQNPGKICLDKASIVLGTILLSLNSISTHRSGSGGSPITSLRRRRRRRAMPLTPLRTHL